MSLDVDTGNPSVRPGAPAGRHHLDMEQTRELAVVGGGERPLASESSITRQATPLVGREDGLAEVRDLLLRPEVRLLTLTGPAGVGKTRLAHAVSGQVASAFAQVTFVDLTPLDGPDQLIPTIACCCGIRESGPAPLHTVLAQALGLGPWLLVLDNCEHLLEAMPEVSGLLAACADLKVLATSREGLRLRWEWVYPVPPLRLPDLDPLPPLDALARTPAVALFVQRARSHQPTFALADDNARAVAELCVRLDGLPLAIELAAARTRQVGPAGLMERLGRLLDLLVGGTRDGPAHHETLEAAFDWSYNSLTPQEQRLFRRLAAFTGGWTLQAAENVCVGEGLAPVEVLPLLARLVDQSLVVAEETADGGRRYRLLETMREYALARLRGAGEEMLLRRRHRDWFLMWAEAGEPDVWGPKQPLWLNQLEAEFSNLWAALVWSRAMPGEAEAGLRLWVALLRFWDIRGHLSQGQSILDSLLKLAPGGTTTRTLALIEAGHLAARQGDLAGARRALEEAHRLSRHLPFAVGTVVSLIGFGHLAEEEGNFPAAEALWQESLILARSAGYAVGIYLSIGWLGHLAFLRGDVARATALMEEALVLTRERGDQWTAALWLTVLGDLALIGGDAPRAGDLFREGLLLLWELRELQGLAICVDGLGQVAWAESAPLAAVRLFGAAEGLRSRSGAARFVADPGYTRAVAAVQKSLGAAAYAAAWAEGKALSPEDAVVLALSVRPRPVPPALPIATGTPPRSALSDREWEVASLIATGLTNRQIAERLVISKRTVDTHVRHILGKLDFTTRSQVAVWAAGFGLPQR
ncbi:MAG: ATP-binding protein [Chloroflexota bacterium]